MVLEQGHIYHLYNQGNNHGLIFFRKANYNYFLKKIDMHISPFADLLAWCLMPNHFHLMIAVRKLEINDRISTFMEIISHGDIQLKLNNSIATMLRSYSRAINIQQGSTGSLFREGTKAVWLGNTENEIMKNQKRLNMGVEVALDLEGDHLCNCFRYIHENPIKAGLVNHITEWEFSSAKDIKEMRVKTLVNKKLINELGLKL
jgi:putative transposase